MARKVSVAIPTTARKAAAAKVAALRAERAARRRAKRPELAARFDRLRAELELRRQEIARIQRDLGRDIRVAVAATAEDRKLDAKLAAASAEDPAIARVAAGRRPQRFLTKTAKPVDPKELHGLVVAALGLGRYPGLVELKPLYPSLARRRPDLARYLIIELDANRRTCRRIAARVADRLRRTGAFTSVRVESLGMQVFSSGGGGTGQGFEMEEPDDRDWHLTSPDDGGVDFRGYRGAIDVYGAWDVLGADAGEDGAEAGAEVVIGHPDTGFREQAEYPAERIDLQNAFNAFLGVTTQPQSVGDPTLNVARHGLTPTGFPYIVQHGTYTASVIVAPKGGNVSGASPGATMLPLRCVDTVILAGDVEVTTAIEHAIDRDVDVISISLGGAPNPALREALAAAVEAGIIVVAAAGQPQGAPLVHQVVSPANYPEAIAIGGSIGPVPWEGAFSGPEVDVSAPAVNVACATFRADGTASWTFGTGTSFATALTAGCAALWLQKHGGRAAIQAAVPGVPVQQVFRHLLKETAVDPTIFADEPPPGGWNTDRFGAGVVNARALLRRQLPAPEDVPPIDEAPPFNVYGSASGLAILDVNEAWTLGLTSSVIGAVAAASGAFAGMAASAGEALGDMWSDLADAGAGALASATAWIGGLGDAVGVVAAIAGADQAARALEGAYAAAAAAAGEVGAYLEEQAAAAEEALKAAEDAIDEALDEAEDAVEDFAEDVEDFAEDAADAATETGAAVVGAVTGAIGGLFG